MAARAGGGAGAAPEKLKPLYKALHEAFEEEDHEAALVAATKLLKLAPDEVEAQAAKAVAALYTGDYALALSTALPAQELERAYALYRLGRGAEALAILDASSQKGDESFRHLRGQALFKECRYDEAADVFAALVSEAGKNGGENAELVTNLYAAFVAARRGQEALARFPLNEELMDSCYELAFNTGAAMVDAGDLAAAEARLREAQATCVRVGEEDGMTTTALLDEGSGIQLELAYVLAARGKRGEAFEMVTTLMNKASKLSDPVVRVLAINNAAALREGGRHHKDMSSNLKKLQGSWRDAESKLMPTQRVLLTLNKALMLVHSGKIDEAKEALAAVKKEEGGREGGQAWWRVAMLEIAIKMQEDENASTSTYSPNADLQAVLQRVRTETSSSSSSSSPTTADAEQTIGTALAQVLMYQSKLQEAASVLESITSLQGYPAHAATLASLYARLGQDDKSLAVFDKALASLPPSLPPSFKIKLLQGAAAVRAAQGDHAGAAKALKGLLEGGEDVREELESDARLRAVAALVLATSWVDVGEAAKLAQKELPAVDLEGGVVNPEALETQGLPRRRSSVAAVRRTSLPTSTAAAAAGGGGEKQPQEQKKKNPEAIKRRRARARAAYLAELAAAGKYDANRPGPPPDPERWIAKSQRSYNKRGKKGRAKFVGAQGSGDGAQKDTARLDVASRVAAEKKKKGGGEEEKAGPMGGVGGVKMAGGRRRKK